MYRKLGDIWFFDRRYLQNLCKFRTTIYCVPANLTQAHIYDISISPSYITQSSFKLHDLLVEGAK